MKNDLYVIVGREKKTGKEVTLCGRAVLELSQKSLGSYIHDCSEIYDNIHMKRCDDPLPYVYSVILETFDAGKKAAIMDAMMNDDEIFFTYAKREDEYTNILNNTPSLILWSTSLETASKIKKAIDAAGGSVRIETIFDNFFERNDYLPAGLYINNVQAKLIAGDTILQRKRFGSTGYTNPVSINPQENYLVSIEGKMTLVSGNNILPFRGNEEKYDKESGGVIRRKSLLQLETDNIMASELAQKLLAAVSELGDKPVINSLTMPVPGGDGFSYVVYHKGDDHFELE